MSLKSPAFQFYPSDFLSDKNVAVLSAEEIGAYILLLCFCWREGSLPNDLEDLASLARLPIDRFSNSWEKRIKRCFTQKEDGTWIHPRLEEEREKQQLYRKKQGLNAQKRWKQEEEGPASEDSAMEEARSEHLVPVHPDGTSTHLDGTPTAFPLQCSSFSSSSLEEERKEKILKKKSRVPENFEVTAQMQSWAKELGISNVLAVTANFLDHHRAKGSSFLDWTAAWRTWMRNSLKFSTGPPSLKSHTSPLDRANENFRGAL